MSAVALLFVLVAAFLHASWNLLAKKSHHKLVFVWWFLLVATILYCPMFLYFWMPGTISTQGWSCIFATGVIHALYFWLTAGAYERGDLSLVYPLSKVSYVVAAREVSIVFSAFFGIFALREKNACQKIIGAALIAMGVVIIGFSK